MRERVNNPTLARVAAITDLTAFVVVLARVIEYHIDLWTITDNGTVRVIWDNVIYNAMDVRVHARVCSEEITRLCLCFYTYFFFPIKRISRFS